MITVRTATGDKAAESLTVRTPDGDKAVARMTLLTATGDELMFQAAGAGSLSATASPPSVNGAASEGFDTLIDTATTTVTATGGTEPYTYAWTLQAGDVGWEAESPLGRSSRFTSPQVAPGASSSATFRCTVTDARSRTGTVDVEANVYNYGSPF